MLQLFKLIPGIFDTLIVLITSVSSLKNWFKRNDTPFSPGFLKVKQLLSFEHKCCSKLF